MCAKASIVRNAKDTAHTKAERNILEAVKVCFGFGDFLTNLLLFVFVKLDCVKLSVLHHITVFKAAYLN